jgi:sugar porter (SP) family MFS transporter
MNTKFHLDPFSSGLIVSSILVGAMLGSLASGHLAAAFGRRSMLMTTTVVLIVGSAVSGLSDTVVTLVIGRFVTGIATGVSASIISLYISEISPATIRGRLNSILHLAMVIGALTASVVTTVLMSEPDGWRAMLYLGSIPALAMVVGTLFLPESPRWLISKSRVSTAKLMLEKLCVSDPDQEIARIQESAEQAQTRNRSTPLWSPTVRPALLIGLALMFFQACTGINIVSFYGPTIFQAAGIKSATDANFLAAVSGGPIGVIMTLFSFQLVDRLGRRPLFLLGVIGLLASSVGFGIAFALLDAGIHAVQAMIFLCFFVFVASFTVSVNIVCGVMISELYPQSVRDRAIGFVTAFNLLCAIVASFVFPMLVDAAGFSVVFFLNAGITALAIPFWHLFMPETRGKSLEEIEKHWLGGGRPAALR